ncbi:MAG TPA: CHASE3 domain-containing protein, partial [Elusimicrobiota bacterium]|nr:CHASE3 domain-containing protein [Elusimicrobiota bacterium]
MKKSSLDPRTIALCFGLALILLGWVSVVSYWSTHQLVRSFNGVGQAHQALEALQTIQLQMESAESSVRGFVITGDNRRLAAYQSARDVVPAKLRDLEILMSGRSLSQKSFKRLRRLLSSHLIYLSNTVAQRRADGYAAAAQWIAAEDDSSNRDAMEAMLGALQKDGLVQVRKRGSSTAEHSLRTKIALGAASAATLLILVWIFGLLLRETSVRRQAESVTDQTEKFLRSIVEHIPYMILVKQAKDLRLTL